MSRLNISLVATALIVVLAPSAALGQTIRTIEITPVDGVQQRRVTVKEGTGTIRGRVFGPLGPLVRAQVQLLAADSDRSLGFSATDSEGRYEFANVFAGTYRVTAGIAGYLPMEFGQRRAFERGISLTLTDRGMLDKIDITLARSGAIMGRIADENGDPVEGAMVQLFQARVVNGRRQLVAVPNVAVRTSNDLGNYRLFGIAPGQYIVSAASGLSVSRTVSEGIPGFAPVYAPNTPSPAEARPILVGLSQEVTDFDITLLPLRTARISGLAVNSHGAPLHPNATFSLNPSQRSGSIAQVPMRGTIPADGSFDIRNVPPGEYVLQIFVQNPREETEGAFGAQFITVAGVDIRDLRVQASAGSRLAGHVIYEGLPEPPDPRERPPANRLEMIQVTTVPLDSDRAPLGGRPARDTVVPTQTDFDLRGLTGPRLVRIDRASGWFLKSVFVRGVDVTDTPLEFGTQAESLDDVEITVTRRFSEVSGRISTARGQPGSGYVLVFSADRDRWTMASRHIRFAKASLDGDFTVHGLPPGDYYVAAVDRLLEGIGEWQDPAVLEELIPDAVRVSVGEDQHQVVSPRLVIR
jgi:hypothetical protein